MAQAHWFDRLADRAADEDGAITRRNLVKTAGLGIGAAGVLGSSSMAQGATALLRAGECKCHDAADRRFDRETDKLIDSVNLFNTAYSGLALAYFYTALAGIEAGWAARKLSCGRCDRNASGDNTPAPPNHSPCRPRGGACPGGPGAGQGDGGDCPDGTTFCTGGLCCFGSDFCCSCGGQPTCCVAAVGCTCC
jgi:hypothetical protein